MNKVVILLLCSLSIFSNASDDIQIQSYIDSVKHFDLDSSDNFSVFPSKMPAALRDQLSLILQGPLGSKLLSMRDKLMPEFVKVDDPYDAFLVSDGKIYYMTNVDVWYALKLDGGNIPDNSYLDVATIGTLISHEIGHTEVGRMALGLEFIDSFIQLKNEVGNVNFVFSREKVYEEEFRAVHLFENPYRSFIGLPLRESYFDKGDVFNYAKSINNL